MIETSPKTPTSVTLLVLDRTALAIMRVHRRRQIAEYAALSVEPSGYMFTNPRGQPLHPEYLYYTLRKLTEAADLALADNLIRAGQCQLTRDAHVALDSKRRNDRAAAAMAPRTVVLAATG